MNEKDILGSIGAFVEEEHALREKHEHGGPSNADDRRRLLELEIALDQCWDLLRQRRARLSTGQDPSEAEIRLATEVEKYMQ